MNFLPLRNFNNILIKFTNKNILIRKNKTDMMNPQNIIVQNMDLKGYAETLFKRHNRTHNLWEYAIQAHNDEKVRQANYLLHEIALRLNNIANKVNVYQLIERSN